ncbi:DUF3108 domain-containing protein [Psychroserpens algicola]|uniref:DUF3108 domain-containing protein n=1 Tax=Psychroserpens algicola TaxID=1719034 RepID=A0ABT0H5N5_9FLAO|nr:DUF3108 domain-containing protein [Psychroserpens algicola]MCK8479690.1 DUF3108 domain-containing protein [Psychroserpens algicola]
MRLLLISAFILCSSISVLAQNNTIAAGEKLTFSASYNMSGLLNELAQVTMETSEVKTSKSTLLKLKCTAATYKKWDSFFKIRDLYESYVNPKTLTPYLYNRDIDEGGYKKFMKYKFNHKTQIVSSLKRKTRKDGSTWEEKKSLKIGASTRDLVTTLYHIRNLDIHKASIGDSQNFKVLFDNNESIVTIKYLNKETINTALGKKECYKLAISINNSNVLKGNNDNLLWLTADANKIPVFAKFKIAVGSGELKIKSATGLKH